MLKKGFFCLCMFFIGSLLIINPTHALLLSFEPDTQHVNQFESATVDLKIDTTGFGLLTGFDLLLDYDPYILDINNNNIEVSQNLGSLSLKEAPFINVDASLNQIYISGSYASDNLGGEITQSQSLNLAKLNFLAKNEGTSHLGFLDVTLYDDLQIPRNVSVDQIGQITDNGTIIVSATGKAVPEPATFLLLGSLLAGLAFSKVKRFDHS